MKNYKYIIQNRDDIIKNNINNLINKNKLTIKTIESNYNDIIKSYYNLKYKYNCIHNIDTDNLNYIIDDYIISL